MKIFIDNYKPIQILNILSDLENYFHTTEQRVEIYSDSGIYHINNNSFKRLYINDVSTSVIKLLNFNLILDKSKIILKEVNHLPNINVSNYITSMKYLIKNSSIKVYMIVEGETQAPNIKESTENKYTHFIPNNFYFEFDEEKYSLEDCKNNLIVFLSLLN
jgi:hypothetical protein